MTNPVPDRPDEHDEPEPEWVECPECKGDGHIMEPYAEEFTFCRYCHGKGEFLNPNLSDYEQACALWARNHDPVQEAIEDYHYRHQQD